MEIKEFIVVNQPIGKFYVFKINPADLIKISKAALRKIESDSKVGEQRFLDSKRQKEIKSYIHKNPLATFPTSIVLSTSNSSVKIIKGILTLDTNIKLSILDGQHRISGFKSNKTYNNFELIVSLFTFDSKEKKSEVFKIINAKQTQVNPSLRNELEQDSEINTPEKFIVSIAKLLNYSDDSVLKNKIEFYNEKSKKPISYAAFHRELIRFVYYEKDYNEIRYYLSSETTHALAISQFLETNKISDKHVLWKFYSQFNIIRLYEIINNFFKAVKFVFSKDWNDSSSFLLKSIGFRVLVILFTDLIRNQEEKTSYEDFLKELLKLSDFNGKINTLNYSASSYADASSLVEIFNSELKKD